MADEFRERAWLIGLALALPPRLEWLAVWVIAHETRRAERWLERCKRPRKGIDWGAAPYVNIAGSIFGGLAHGRATKRAAEAQIRAQRYNDDLMRELFEKSRRA